MLQLLRELPDWALGLGTGVIAWYGLAYTVLAERALERDVKEKATPTCLSQLQSDQNKTRARVKEHRTAILTEKKLTALNALRGELTQLKALSLKLELVEQANDIVKDTAIGNMLKTYMPMAQIPSTDEIAKRSEQLEKTISEWENVSINLTFPEASLEQIQATCSCAITQAIVGEKTNYAISLASFRIIAPTEISNIKNSVADVLNVKGCGEQPWESFRDE